MLSLLFANFTSDMFSTVEFYVITAFIAAAVVAFAAMPSRRAAARDFFFAGKLIFDAAPSEPGIVAVVEDNGTLSIYRFGLTGVKGNGAYSLAVRIIGFDVSINERLTAGSGNDVEATAAIAQLDCLAVERYHFHYVNEKIGRSAAFSLNIRPGNRIERKLE